MTVDCSRKDAEGTVSRSIHRTVDGQKSVVLDLKPRKASGSIKTIRLWIDEQRWLTVQSKFTEPRGGYSISNFTNIKLNGSIPDSRFKLDLPKDVTIVRM